MVTEIGVHVGVVDPVVQARIGHGDDDARAVKARPTRVDGGHVRAAPHVGDVHDLNALGVENLKEGLGFNPFHAFLTCEPSKAVDVDLQRGKPSAVGMDVNIVPVVDALGQVVTGQHDVDEGEVLVHEGVGGHHLKAHHPTDEVHLHLVHRIHAGHALNVERCQAGG